MTSVTDRSSFRLGEGGNDLYFKSISYS
jgi:hypothetical protein